MGLTAQLTPHCVDICQTRYVQVFRSFVDSKHRESDAPWLLQPRATECSLLKPDSVVAKHQEQTRHGTPIQQSLIALR